MPVETALRERFGLEALRPLQQPVIDRVMDGGDALVVAPTGSGKSLCYQLPAVALPGEGFTLVFSPLIALMEDQVASLVERGIRAGYINSTLSRKERALRYERAARGDYEILYVTPERMEKSEFVDVVQATDTQPVKLLAVDEAHCISKWGHDLRPAYRQVGRFRGILGRPPTVALTATATPAVRDDVRAVLGDDATSMPLFADLGERANLDLRVAEIWDDADRAAKIVETTTSTPGTGIVYFTLIRDLERTAARVGPELPEREIGVYHGRLDPREKKRVYDRFARAAPEDGLVLFATNAFGLGVDKPDIRFIVHAQVPGSIEAYFQEVGRAGRDGLPSRCLLLYAQDDLAIQQEFAEWTNPPPDLVRRAVHALEAGGHHDFDAEELNRDLFGRTRVDRRLEYTLIALDHLGVIEPTPVPGRFRLARALEEGDLDEEEMAAKRQRDLQRLLDVVRMVKEGDPRSTVRAYFDLERPEGRTEGSSA